MQLGVRTGNIALLQCCSAVALKLMDKRGAQSFTDRDRSGVILFRPYRRDSITTTPLFSITST